MISKLKFGKGLKNEVNDFSICIPSRRWTSAMEFVLNECSPLGIKVYWIKHGKLGSAKPKNVEILNYLGKAGHAEEFFFNSIREIKTDGWILRLDDDEVLGEKTLLAIKNLIPSLSADTIYGVPRIWVRRIGKTWFKSRRTKPQDSDSDYQYRLFRPNYVKADLRIHTSGVLAKRKKKISQLEPIIHVIWEVSTLEERILKIREYESVETGAGIGKIRYYLPELYPTDSSWEKLNSSEIRTTKRWFDNFKDMVQQ
jgi:hypothetical protein